MRKDLVRKSLALALVMMILLTNSVEMITSVYAEDVKELEEEEEVKEAEEFEENAEDESDVDVYSEEEVELESEVEKKTEKIEEDAKKNEFERETEKETEPESEVDEELDESEIEAKAAFEDRVVELRDEDGVREVSDEGELIEALGYGTVERIIITDNMHLTRFNDDFKRILDKGIIIEGEEGKKPTLTTKDGQRHFYIATEEKVVFKNLIFKDDSESHGDGEALLETMGGGIESGSDVDSDIEIVNCDFTKNKASWNGGAIFIENGELNIEDSTFESNEADYAGAIDIVNGNVNIKGSKFESNKASWNGGAIFIENGELNIEDSTFESNEADYAGAIDIVNGNVNIKGSKFESNKASGGGAIYIANGNVSIEDSKFESNKASGGGAILLWSGNASIKDSTFESNEADYAGAIEIVNGNVNIEDSNFKFNEGEDINTGGGELKIFGTTFQGDTPLIGIELEDDVEVELNEIYFKGKGQFINILDSRGHDKECNIELKNSVIESADINLLSYNMGKGVVGEGVARNDEVLVAYNGNPFELAESMEPAPTEIYFPAPTEINLTVDKTFFNTKILGVGLVSNSEIDVNFYNNTIVNDNSLKLGNVRGLFAHNTIKTEELEFEVGEVGQEGIEFKNNIIITDTKGIEGQNIILEINDETGINKVIENKLTEIKDGGPVVRKYFKPVENSEAKGFDPINNIGELSNDMLGNARTDSVTAGAVEAETVVNTPKDDPDIPSDPGSSETPKKPETPKKQETPRSSGGSSRGRREKIMTLIGNGGTFTGEDLSVKLNKGDKIIEPKRGNFELIGWTSKQGGKLEKSTEELQEILENLTRSEEYYALWREKTLNREDHLGYIKGYPDGRVLPENNVSREEVAAIFYRLLDDNYKSKVRRDNNNFTDVDGNRWSNVEVSTLSKAGIINGYEDGSFRPQNKITRAEVATIASRFDNLSAGEASFADIDGHWAKDYIVSASIKGWIRGYEDGSFRPNDYITRAELVTLVNNVLERKVRKENILSGIKEFKDLDKNKWYYENMVEAINSHEYEMLEDGTEKWIKLIDKSF